MANTYYLPEQYGGMSLNRITGDLKSGNPEVLAQYLGVDRNAPLTAGQQFNFSTPQGVNPSGSGEFQFLNQYFTPGAQYEQQKAQEFAQQQTDTLNQAKTEAIGTLQAGKDPLKARYDEIIASIKGTSDLETQKAETAKSVEFGKRGIPLTSDVYQTALQGARLPIQTATASSLANVGLQEQQGINQIDQAIANIQAATGRDQVQTALQLFQIQENARLNGLSLEESARQFNENLAFQRDQANRTQSDPFSQFTSLGEGSTLFDLLSGQPVYTAPKTYKPTGSGGSFDFSTAQ